MLAILSVAIVGFFGYGLLYRGRQMPPSIAAPRVGAKAPDFTLPDQSGKPVSLAQLLATPTGKLRGLVLIFYRGHW